MCAVGTDVDSVRSTYDRRKDILYVVTGVPAPATYEENVPGILIRRRDDDNKVIGAVVVGFSRRSSQELQRAVPLRINWDELREQHQAQSPL